MRRTSFCSHLRLMAAGLLDLPLPLLWLVVEKLQLRDILLLSSSCTSLQRACQDAPLSLHPTQGQVVGPAARPQGESSPARWLQGLCTSFPHVAQLDLRGSLVRDADVRLLLHQLPHLKRLGLASCQKLTVKTAEALTLGVAPGVMSLELVDLQRCFRLADPSLPLHDLLTGAFASRRRLRSLALSHISSLDNLRPVAKDPVLAAQASGSASDPSDGVPRHSSQGSLRVLALHSCGQLDAAHLVFLAAACPQLEVLCLGGCGVGGLRAEEVTEPLARLPHLQVLEVTFWEQRGADARGLAACGASFVAEVSDALRRCERDPRERGHVQVWDLCNPVHVGAACAWAQTLAQDVEKRALAAASNCSNARRCTPLHVAAAAGDALTVMRLLKLGATAGEDGATNGPRDAGGATALFLAAESGHAACVAALMRGGANLLACNRGNESPLYIAALKGHVDVVAAMLRHCGDRGLGWQDAGNYGEGWTPLMAAAVADRQEVALSLLKAACKQTKLEPPPLLPPIGAPAFISTTVISRRNRRRSGRKGHSSLSRESGNTEAWMRSKALIAQSRPASALGVKSIPLLDARNKYGSTALHISAMKGLPWFVLNLLMVGADWRIKDCYGQTPKQVAMNLGHTDVEDVLSMWDSEGRLSQSSA